MTAEEFFTKEWGPGSIKVTLHQKNSVVEMSLYDIYDTMEKYANHVDAAGRTSRDHAFEPRDNFSGTCKHCDKGRLFHNK